MKTKCIVVKKSRLNQLLCIVINIVLVNDISLNIGIRS